MSIPTPRPLILALVLLGATVPAGLLAPAAGAAKCQDSTSFGTEQHIVRSSPLAGHLTATELVHIVAERSDHDTPTEDKANGVDAFVYDMGCTSAGTLTYQLYDRTPGDMDANFGMRFYDQAFQPVGPTHTDEGDREGEPQLDGVVPKGAVYAVVILEGGPLFAGMTDEVPPEPYSAKFELNFLK